MDISSLSVSALNQVNDPSSQKKLESSESSMMSGLQSRVEVPKTQQMTQEEVTSRVEKLNQQLEQMGNQSLMFAIDESTQSSVVKLVDRNTEELVKQFPSEDTLKMMKNIQDYLNRSDSRIGSNGQEGLTGSLLNEII